MSPNNPLALLLAIAVIATLVLSPFLIHRSDTQKREKKNLLRKKILSCLKVNEGLTYYQIETEVLSTNTSCYPREILAVGDMLEELVASGSVRAEVLPKLHSLQERQFLYFRSVR